MIEATALGKKLFLSLFVLVLFLYLLPDGPLWCCCSSFLRKKSLCWVFFTRLEVFTVPGIWCHWPSPLPLHLCGVGEVSPDSLKFHHKLHCFDCVQDKAVVWTPPCQVLDLLSVASIVLACYQSHNSGVVRELHCSAGRVNGCAVTCEQSKESWAKNTALWCSCDQGENRWCVVPHPDVLWSVC